MSFQLGVLGGVAGEPAIGVEVEGVFEGRGGVVVAVYRGAYVGLGGTPVSKHRYWKAYKRVNVHHRE